MGDAEAHCRDVIARLYLFLDNELEEADCVELSRHFESCAHCGGLMVFERELRVVVRRKCRESVLPEGLEEKVRAVLRSLG